MKWDVAVIGGGAAGLMAAIRAAECNRRTLLLEKNARIGVKILMSGGTRCNLTHATDRRGIVAAFGKQGKFLHSALARLDPNDLVAMLDAEGVPSKVESTGKVFPVSDRAGDVLDALRKRMQRSGAVLASGQAVRSLRASDNGFLLETTVDRIHAANVIVTTGGQSYPGCGTTGDGYVWAENFGHAIIPRRPALTPITTNRQWVRSLSGITLPDVEIAITEPPHSIRKCCLGRTRGSMLFTHFGLSGPVVLDLSRVVSGYVRPHHLKLHCDFQPATTRDEWQDWLRRRTSKDGKKTVAATVVERLPRRLVEHLAENNDIDIQRRLAEFNKRSLTKLVEAVKATTIEVSGVMGFRKAEVTAGGVALHEIDSSTMESKLVDGLYFAGEILDLDGPIGGFNFQAAFSTGWLAGESVAHRPENAESVD